MPCRCDGYEVSDGEKIADLSQKLHHLEGQLCNARSLIHKMLKFIDHSTTNLLDPALRARAEEHVKILLAHKRAEHKTDHERAWRELAELSAQLEREALAAQRARSEADIRLNRIADKIAELKKAPTSVENPTDEDLLG